MDLPDARGFLTVQDIETGTIKSLDISTTLKKQNRTWLYLEG